jgi:hypothetical protein
MSRRRRNSISPNLFPFLAVLVCTLGTLILLLALVSQQANDSAEKLVQEETESAKRYAEEERWEAEKLIEFRDKQTRELENRRSELAHLEDHARRLRDELESLREEVLAAEQEQDPKATAEIQHRLVALRSQTEREKELIRDLETERDGRPPRVVIVPYRGGNGTDRRPIYIECTSAAVIIQPEGVRITASQLDGPMGPGNPLDAALRAVRSHWQKNDPGSPPPYPLLLVRPTGIHAYAACRIAMSTWDDQFGYELIPESLELAFPEKDPLLETKLIAAVDDAVARGRSRMAGAPARYPRFSPDQVPYRSSSGGGGTGGNFDAADGSANGGQGDAMAGEDRSLANGGPAGAVGQDDGRGQSMLAGPRLGAADGSSTAMAANSPGFGLGGGMGTERGDGTAAGDDSDYQFSIDAEDLMAKPYRDGGTGGGGTGDLAAEGTQSIQGVPDDQSPAGDMAAEAWDGSSTSSASGFGGGPSNNSSATAANSTAGPAGTATGNGGSNGSPPPGSASQPAGADPGRIGSMTPFTDAPDPHEKTFSETLDANRAMASNESGAGGGQRPVLRSGNNWALPESMLNRRGTTIVRQIDIQCTPTGFVLMPEGNRGVPQVFPIQDGQVEKSVLEMATAIRDRVSLWGVAMQNGRWDPVLSVRVAPGGDDRFLQLQTLLRDSGLRVERESLR